IAELIVRIQALLRRAGRESVVGERRIQLDPAAHGARLGERTAQLTPTEFRLLGALVARPGEGLRRAELGAAARADGAIVPDNTLDAYAGRLRRKLAALEAPERIETVRGVGYVLR